MNTYMTILLYQPHACRPQSFANHWQVPSYNLLCTSPPPISSYSYLLTLGINFQYQGIKIRVLDGLLFSSSLCPSPKCAALLNPFFNISDFLNSVSHNLTFTFRGSFHLLWVRTILFLFTFLFVPNILPLAEAKYATSTKFTFLIKKDQSSSASGIQTIQCRSSL